MNTPGAWIILLGLLVAGLLSGPVAAQPNDPFAHSRGSWQQDFADQWALEQQRIYADIAPNRRGERVVVAVIDTGLDFGHEDLAGEKIWRNTREQKNGRDDDNNGFVDDLVGWNFVAQNNNPFDESGHGTHIAGVIAACTNNGLGIAAFNADAVIMPLKVANFVGQARSTNVAAAIYYAVDHGAAIINLSLGGELITELEKEAARYAAERGVLLVVSAGNRGMPVEKHGYAGLPEALVVGALAPNGDRAGFSNFGAGLHVLAPGVDILSLRARDTDFIALSDPLDYIEGAAIVGEEGNYYRATGTSFAAAVASGVAAKLKSMRPELSAHEIKTVMQQRAADITPPGIDQRSGFGGLDYIAALGGDPYQTDHVRFTQADLELADKTLFVRLFGQVESSDFQGAVLSMRPLAGSIPVAESDEKDKRKRSRSREREERKKRKKEGDEPAADPYAWQVLVEYDQPQPPGELARFNIDDLTQRAGGSTQWELMLTAGQQVASMTLAMPQPEEFIEEEQDEGDE